MSAFNPTKHTAPIAALLKEPRLPELGPGQPNLAVRPLLATLTPENISSQLRDRSMALACISGLWLFHDFLDESHGVSQEIATTTGSFWHGIMHRREPDAANAKYWFRQVDRHPVFDILSTELGSPWDPSAFVDRIEMYRDTGSDEERTCRRLQMREWELLFDWCIDRAGNG